MKLFSFKILQRHLENEDFQNMATSSCNFYSRCLNKENLNTLDIKKFSLFSTLREPSGNRKDLRALTIVGHTRDDPKLDP